MHSMKFHLGPLSSTLLHPAGGQPLKQPCGLWLSSTPLDTSRYMPMIRSASKICFASKNLKYAFAFCHFQAYLLLQYESSITAQVGGSNFSALGKESL
jgi:hypothetical protein